LPSISGAWPTCSNVASSTAQSPELALKHPEFF
jgi:hypothetical protein